MLFFKYAAASWWLKPKGVTNFLCSKTQCLGIFAAVSLSQWAIYEQIAILE